MSSQLQDPHAGCTTLRPIGSTQQTIESKHLSRLIPSSTSVDRIETKPHYDVPVAEKLLEANRKIAVTMKTTSIFNQQGADNRPPYLSQKDSSRQKVMNNAAERAQQLKKKFDMVKATKQNSLREGKYFDKKNLLDSKALSKV